MADTSDMNSGHEGIAGTLAGFETGSRPVGSLAGRLGDALLPRWAAREGIWPRIGLLFGAFCLVKVLLLIGFRKHLFEIHWRVGGQPYNGVNVVCFYLFAVLVGLHLWRLGTQCMTAGKRVVRAANVCVLILCAAFIFLTFREGDKNYLSPVMNCVLTWKDLRWYLALDFCFRPPYLAAWILGYAFVYYGLARTGREHLVLRFTAVCASVYIALYLADLTRYHDALVIVDCLGVACLCFSWRARQALGFVWMGLLLLETGFVFGLYYGMDSRLSLTDVNPEFAVLSSTGLILVAGVSVFAWRRGFFSGWSWITPFALAAFLLFTNANYSSASNYSNLLCEGFTLPRYFLGELAVASSLFLFAVAYRRWRPSGSLWWLDGVGLLCIAFALADLRLSQIMGVRLDWQALSLAWGETPKMMWRMARPYLPALACVLLVAGAVYTIVLSAIRGTGGPQRVGHKAQSFLGAKFFLLSFVLLGLAGEQLTEHDKVEGQSALLLVKTSPLWRRAVDPAMDRKTFVATAQLLGMDPILKPQAVPAHAERDLNVVLVIQESSYSKYLSLFNGIEDTQPLLSNYKDRMEVFPNFFTSFAGSIQARFACLTGLYPVQNYKSFTLQRVEVKSTFELLHARGYTCSLFYSSFCDYTGFRDFLHGRNLDEIYDADTMPGERKTKPVSWGVREEETLGAMQARIKRYAAEHQKFFLTYVPAAPHYPYDGTPHRFYKYQKKQIGDFTPLYLNELLYMDWIISSLIDQLRDSGVLDRTLVIITDDHGESLGADGGPIGHGWAVTPDLANVPLIIMDPENRGYHVNYTVGSQVDLTPTILDLLGIPIPGSQLCQGNSLYSVGADTNRTIYLNSYRDYATIKGNLMICGNRETPDAGNATNAFSINNQGARTSFVGTDINDFAPFSISTFDHFQESLLLHYSQYCQIMRQQQAGK